MKRLIRLFCLIAAATALGSCARDKVIPDEELARSFRDAYLINAYVSDRGVKLDSLELYEPVFSRYGYTAEDVRYTIGNFSRRKSAKLSDVVEQSIRLLEEESAYYKYEVGVLDTIDNVARRRFTRTVYSDSLIRVTRIKDTARLRVRIPDTRPGEYRVSFDYLIDSLDENLAPRMRVWLGGGGRQFPQGRILLDPAEVEPGACFPDTPGGQFGPFARTLPVRDPRKVQASRRDDIRPESILYARNRRGRGQPLHRPVGS